MTSPKWPGGGRQLVAYIVLSGADAPSPRDLRSFLQHYLPDPMIPARFVTLDRLPLTSTGKVDRRRLPDVPSSAPPAPQMDSEPRTSVARRLASIWSSVLSTSRVGVDENFFELGGHSLLAVQVIARAREAFAISLPLHELFEHPTLDGFARRVEAAIAREHGEPSGARDEIVL